MRPGVVGLLPHDPREITAAHARALREAGFTGVSIVMPDPAALTDAELDQARETLAAEGVRVAQTNCRYEVMVHPDEARRQAGLNTLRQAIRCARRLDAATQYVRPGSLNPAGAWTPHPQNTRPETLARLVESLRQAAKMAEDAGVVLALEGHVVSPLDTAERMRDVLEAVGSPALRFNADPVNFVGGLADAWDTTAFLNHLFDVLGPYTVAAHAKDVRVEDRLVLHLSECPIGEGILDQETFLRRFHDACPDGYVLIEHLPAAKIPDAKRALDAAAARTGLAWS